MTVSADDLDVAISAVVAALRPATDRDWSVPAEAVGVDCWHAAEHLGDCLLSYAGQLVARPDGRYVRFLAKADEDASAAEVLEFAEAGARILAATVRSAPPGTRAFHPTGRADPEGFAGMGCVEALVHGEDIARGLGVAVDPPRGVCERVLDRMFPTPQYPRPDGDPWLVLLWSAGRIELPGLARLSSWRWRGAPLDE